MSRIVDGEMTAETGALLAPDLVSAVRRVFRPPKAATQVIRTLRSVDSDRLQVAILVSATLKNPDHRMVEALARQAKSDFRDVLMVEYDDRVDYPAQLRLLGLKRPYPVQ